MKIKSCEQRHPKHECRVKCESNRQNWSFSNAITQKIESVVLYGVKLLGNETNYVCFVIYYSLILTKICERLSHK